ncbi:MAG: putative toxin-antitoxin system toxin component, PIN family [Gammaproteobacteria bacterium]|nr:putative toxin-antitoxin system toxin component, PIN family [Gammaproteobacteria bacterium]
MRVVIDTNVLVAALISPTGKPARIVDKIRAQAIQPVVGRAILEEYRLVLARPRFGFDTAAVDELLDDMAALSLAMPPAPVDAAGLPDADDAPFIGVAVAAGCPVVIGNSRHFPPDCGVEVLSPAQFLQRMHFCDSPT